MFSETAFLICRNRVVLGFYKFCSSSRETNGTLKVQVSEDLEKWRVETKQIPT
jgi:hypothetical protein